MRIKYIGIKKTCGPNGALSICATVTFFVIESDTNHVTEYISIQICILSYTMIQSDDHSGDGSA